MARFASHEAYPFWQTMKEGYDYFELTRKLPTVAVCNRRYVVNVALKQRRPVAARSGRRLPGIRQAQARSVQAEAR